MRQVSTPDPVPAYSRVARTLHWLTVLLVALQFPVGFAMVHRGGTLNVWDALTNAMYSGHKLGGLLIFAVVVLRLSYRAAHGAPPDEPTLEPWQRVVSHLTHWAIYALLLVVPLAGYVGISMFPALDLFGLVELPAVTGPDKAGAATVFAVHAWLAIALGGLIAMHVGAALFHRFVRRDGVMDRMLPGRVRSR